MTIISRVQYEMENEKGEKIETEIWKVYTLRHYVSQLWNNNTVLVWGVGTMPCPSKDRHCDQCTSHTDSGGVIAIETSVIRHQSTDSLCRTFGHQSPNYRRLMGIAKICGRFICYKVLVIFSLPGQFISISVDSTGVHNTWPM